MKKCKHCQSEIDDKAKNCPQCKKKQSHIVGWILLGVLILLIVSCAMGGEEEVPFQKDYSQNEVVTYEGVNYSILKVEKTQGNNEFIKPDDGNEYVKVTIRIENNSNEKISYNALDWQMVNADGVEDAWGTITADDDKELSSGDLDAGGKVEGVLVWEQKIGDDNLRLRYYGDIFDEGYTFQFKLD